VPRAVHIRCRALLALSLVSGCIQTQFPYSFTTPERPEPLLGTLVRVVEVQVGPVVETVPQYGLVRTRWENTGQCWINPNAHPQVPGSLLRRFTIVTNPIASGGSSITVRTDIQCCDNPVGVSSDGRSIQGRCVTPDGVYAKHQREVDAIGSALRQAVAHSNY
jgi:hypothetical protein